MKLTVEEFNKKLWHWEEGDPDEGMFAFQCASCDAGLSTDGTGPDDLLPPCHPDGKHFVEGSGYGGTYFIFCASNEPDPDGAYCGWGGPVEQYEALVVCAQCKGNPFLREEE